MSERPGNAPKPDRPLGFVLSAGSGSRFSGSEHKLLHRIDGVSILRRSVMAAETACEGGSLSDVIVIAGALTKSELRAELSGLQCQVVSNRRWADGIATSLQVAVSEAARLRAHSIVIGLADQPFVGPQAWDRVATRRLDRPIAVAAYRTPEAPKRHFAPPVRLDRSVWDELPRVADRGARVLWESRQDLVAWIDVDGRSDDIDTVDDANRAQITARVQPASADRSNPQSEREHARIVDASRCVQVAYTPDRDGEPDPGEVVWAWVPFEEDPGQGKDRPALVIGFDGPELVLVALTTKHHGPPDDLVAVGTGPWDPQARPSFAKVEHLLRIGPDGVRREGATMPKDRFDDVLSAVRSRHGLN